MAGSPGRSAEPAPPGLTLRMTLRYVKPQFGLTKPTKHTPGLGDDKAKHRAAQEVPRYITQKGKKDLLLLIFTLICGSNLWRVFEQVTAYLAARDIAFGGECASIGIGGYRICPIEVVIEEVLIRTTIGLRTLPPLSVFIKTVTSLLILALL